MKLVEKVKNIIVSLYNEVVLHWTRPAKGNYVGYKEIIHYSVGGMGKLCLDHVFTYIALSAGNLFFGTALGIRPMHLQTMAMISTFINIVMIVLRGKLVDNTRTRWGKFRPYVALMALPLAIACTVMFFLPFDTMQYTSKFAFVFLFSIGITMALPLYQDTYIQLAGVMSPNSSERAKIVTISTLIASFAPTIFATAIPIIMSAAGLNYTNLSTYRFIIAPLGFIGVGLSLFGAIGTKERIVASKTYVPKVSVVAAVGAAFRNKYWWIRTLAGTMGFLESGFGSVFAWMYIYGSQDMSLYGVLLFFYGTASTIAMLITPFLLKKLGNRRLLLFHNSMNIIFITLMMLSFKINMLYFLFLYINTIFNQLQLVYNPVLDAEVKDYQQYLSGKRVDFLLGAASQVLVPITLLTGYVYPFLYEAFGLSANYDVMFDPVVRYNLFYMLCSCSIAGAALNLIPFFFYRLSIQKHRTVILVLKERAALTDQAEGDVSASLVVDVVEGVRKLEEYRALPDPDVKTAMKEYYSALFMPIFTKEQRAARRPIYKAAAEKLTRERDIAEYKEAIAEIYDKEQNKFCGPIAELKLQIATIVAAIERNDLIKSDFSPRDIELHYSTELEHKKMLRIVEKQHKQFEKMKLGIAKEFPDGVHTDFLKDVEAAYALPEDTKEQSKAKRLAMATTEKALIKYSKVFAFYISAVEMVVENDNAKHYAELEAKYDWAVAKMQSDADEMNRKIAADKEARAKEIAELKAQRFAMLSPERQRKILERRAKRDAKKAAKVALAGGGAVTEIDEAAADEDKRGIDE